MNTSWREVLRECLALAKPYGTEKSERPMAVTRVLAKDVFSDRDYPGGDLSMMDGYAIIAKAVQQEVLDLAKKP